MEEAPVSSQKTIKSSLWDEINNKTSITCTKVPESLFDAKVVEKHFGKFGKIVRIRLLPKKQTCIIEYEQKSAAERAVLNAGAFDGFMFDVTRTKTRIRKSKKDDDPDWLPDPEVEEELNAMKGAPAYRISRQKAMEIEAPKIQLKPLKAPISKKPQQVITIPKHIKPVVSTKQTTSGIESPIPVTVPTSMSLMEAATEVHKLRSRISMTPDEKWRTLDARDRILRAWGGAGSRVVVGGATIGTCPDMCPEKELLHRQAEHQVMTLETMIDSDGLLEPWRAVKQYSRSSADQEIPMCYELRPPPVLMTTTAYLLHEIADTTRQVTLADWFHFMWDRFRGIRKDITQQALCCAESIRMVEICARFHAHCAARLADLEHTQFDQKLNTDNLTKCLQTLKHMYADVGSEAKPNEAEFRGYIALLNLGDANFWWEIKQLPQQIQKSQYISFAIQIYTALDNNNYVKFFRLVREKATYLQACILLRYFNDVRARALARIVKAYAPRGGSKYPAEDLFNILSFETVDSMKSFVNHYGLRFAKNEEELTIILSRNNFIEDSDPFPLSRAIEVIESKRQSTVGEVISGGPLPNYDYANRQLYSSFTSDGRLKETALIAEDVGYDTKNDSNKDVNALKLELQKLLQSGRNLGIVELTPEPLHKTLFTKPDFIPRKTANLFSKPAIDTNQNKLFLFQPAIPVAPIEVIHNSPEKVVEEISKNIFTFSKPLQTESNVFANLTGNLFSSTKSSTFDSNSDNRQGFGKPKEIHANLKSTNLFKKNESVDMFKNTTIKNSIFGQPVEKEPNTNFENNNTNIFMSADKNLFSKDEGSSSKNNLFSQAGGSLFKSSIQSTDKTTNKSLFSKDDGVSSNKNLFGQVSGNLFKNTIQNIGKDTNIFAQPYKDQVPMNPFGTLPQPDPSYENKVPFESYQNGSENLSPGTLFKNANQPLAGIFQSKNKAPSVADNIFNSVNMPINTYNFGSNYNNSLPRDDSQYILEQKRIEEERERLELQRLEEAKRKEEERKKMEELKRINELRKKEEEKKQEELRKKLEEERQIELKRKAEEEILFKEKVDRESSELVEEFVNEIENEEVKTILTEENERLRSIIDYAVKNAEEICFELLSEMCDLELRATIFRRNKLMAKWFRVWRMNFIRNFRRRSLLEDTPVWLPDKPPQEEARYLRRITEDAELKYMNAINRGYKFNGELRLIPSPKPYNMLDLIRSPLLKRMKQIEYPYDKCFFWKVTIVSPGSTKYLYKKINVETWLHDVFGDNNKHDVSDSLINVSKHSWNNIMDFAVSISLINKEKFNIANEALSGANGLIFYFTESDNDFNEIEQTLKHKYKYQVVPIAIVAARTDNLNSLKRLEEKLAEYKTREIISNYRIYIVDRSQMEDSINASTKSAVRWLAKNYPKSPPLEIDYLKSICQRYLGNEIWCKLKAERNQQANTVLKDLQKLVICYNKAVDKLTEVITNEDLFNYASFPLEFNKYLDNMSPYPKPYEFITSNVKQSDNTSAIKRIMQNLKLPPPNSVFLPNSVRSMQDEIRKYCKEISWFPDTEEVVCKVVAVLPDQFSDLNLSREDFNKYFENYDLIDLLNVIVYEKIRSQQNFENRFAMYTQSSIEEYRRLDWLYEVEVFSKTKHRVIDYEDDIDYFIEAKRRKIEMDSMEYLVFEDKDYTLVQDNIEMVDQSISKFSYCKDAVSELERQVMEDKKKSDELENLLRLALSNV